jgi:hypothetical protein
VLLVAKSPHKCIIRPVAARTNSITEWHLFRYGESRQIRTMHRLGARASGTSCANFRQVPHPFAYAGARCKVALGWEMRWPTARWTVLETIM